MTDEITKLIHEEIVEPVASLKIEEGEAFLSAIKSLLGV